MKRKITRKKIVTPVEPEKESLSPTSLSGLFKNYPKIIGMFVLLLFCPPLGWLFTYKYSPYDKKTSAAIAAVCTLFFVYAGFISPEHSFIDTAKLTRENFSARYNEQATKLAPKLGITLDEKNLTLDGENFSYAVTNVINFEGKVDAENNFVREVTVTAVPKTTDESFQALNCYGLVIATLNPELDQDKRGEILRELKLLETNVNENTGASTVSGRINYAIKTEDGKVTFTATISQ